MDADAEIRLLQTTCIASSSRYTDDCVYATSGMGYRWLGGREHIFSFTAHLTSGRLTISNETRDVCFCAPAELPTNTFAEHVERIHDALAGDSAPVIAVPRAVSAAIEKRQR